MHLKMILSIFLAFILSVMFVLPVSAEVTLDDLLKRIEALEQENATLKSEVMALKEKQASQTEQITQVQTQATKAVASATGAATPAPAGNFLKTKFDMELYGFIKADATYADSEGSASATAGTSGNSSVAVYNAPYNTLKKHQPAFNASGQSTRLGINFNPVAIGDGGKISGKFETDFSANIGPT
jgi:hypothetical protein